MLTFGIILALVFYAAANTVRWHYAKHYERHFKLMSISDLREAFEYVKCTMPPECAKAIIGLIALIGAIIAGGILNLFVK